MKLGTYVRKGHKCDHFNIYLLAYFFRIIKITGHGIKIRTSKICKLSKKSTLNVAIVVY